MKSVAAEVDLHLGSRLDSPPFYWIACCVESPLPGWGFDAKTQQRALHGTDIGIRSQQMGRE